MKRFATLLLTLIMLMTCMLPCAQAENAAPRSSNFFTSYGTTLSKEGNGRIKIVFSTTGTCVCNQLGVATYHVEKQNENGKWENVSDTLYGSMGTNITNYTFSRYFNGVAGETYRVKVNFICVINNACETQAYTSGIITAK